VAFLALKGTGRHVQAGREFDRCRVKSLIMGAGGDILPGQDGQKPFQFMFAWPSIPNKFTTMKGK
jgi:hypothetical protein